MTIVLHIGAALTGLALLSLFFRSVFHVAVINRQYRDRLSYGVGRLAHAVVSWRAMKRRTYAGVQDALAWDLPAYMTLLIIVWFGLVQSGFSLIIWSLEIERNPVQAIIASGSALSTLGFLTPPGIRGQFLAILEGGIGLGIVVFFFTFIPGYQNSIELRQAKVAWLYARGCPNLTNFTLLEWFQSCGRADWNELWEGWEIWFRNVAETHALAPILAFVPTVHRGQTWLAAATVALDSVSLYLAALQAPEIPSAIICHRTGVDALNLIAGELPLHKGALEPEGCRLTRHEFDQACGRLEALGAKLSPERDACWLRFVELRGQYEAVLPILAATLLLKEHSGLMLPLAPAVDPASPTCNRTESAAEGLEDSAVKQKPASCNTRRRQ